MDKMPYVILKCAVSIDGYIDDESSARLILSDTKDFDMVDEVRSTCDAILLGSEAIRKDNPSLLIKSEERRKKRLLNGLPENPMKVTITSSGKVTKDLNFFKAGDSRKVVYCTKGAYENLRKDLSGLSEIVPSPSENDVVDLRFILHDLKQKGINKLMIEGGAKISTQFLSEGLVDEMQISIAPFFVGEANATKFLESSIYPHDKKNRMRLESVQMVGDMALLTYHLKKYLDDVSQLEDISQNEIDLRFMEKAVRLSELCCKSHTAYSVGAILVDENNNIIAQGYSREVEGNMHAEEIVINKAINSGIGLKDSTIYSTIEPCGLRLSGKKCCADRIIENQIKRVVFCMKEPNTLVNNPTGEKKLKKSGIHVDIINDFKNRVLLINEHIPN